MSNAKTNTKTNATKTTTNSSKSNKTVNEILTVSQVNELFVKNNLLPKFTDTTHYVGCGTRANVFSVNALKTKYNIYCSDNVFEVLSSTKFTDVECIANGNSSDKTRPHTIECKSTQSLEKLIQTVVKSFSQYAMIKSTK